MTRLEKHRLSQARRRQDDPENDARIRLRGKRKQEELREEIAGRPRPLVCDVCTDLKKGPIVFDHCHKSPHFRGWICDRCNRVLGLVYDDGEILERLKDYVERDKMLVHRPISDAELRYLGAKR